MRIALRITTALSVALLWAHTVQAGPHPAYSPVKVDGIPTYKGAHSVGPFVFTMAFPDKGPKKLPGTLDKLTFGHGKPPAEWWGRAYFPASLKEAADSIEYATRGHAMFTQVYLDKQEALRTTSPMEDDMKSPSWNTASFEGADLNAELAKLDVGTHKMTIWRQLNYQVAVKDKDTGAEGWDDAYISLAKGVLTIEVKP